MRSIWEDEEREREKWAGLEEDFRGWKQNKNSGWRAGDKIQSGEVESGAVGQAGCPDVGKFRCCASLLAKATFHRFCRLSAPLGRARGKNIKK